MTLACLWQSADDPNDVFFLLDVEDVDRANAFMARPESQEIVVKSGVIDGEFHYLEAVPTGGYHRLRQPVKSTSVDVWIQSVDAVGGTSNASVFVRQFSMEGTI